MSGLNQLKKPIESHLQESRRIFRKTAKSRIYLLDLITSYIVKSKGKQMRPMFVIYSSMLFENVNPSTYHAATLIELMHTATLIHDDVVDESMERRGRFSINALWKNKAAVLVGDYLLSRGLLMTLENKEYHLLEIVSKAVKDMSEGELLQIEKARKLDIDEEVYYEIIRQKTASLLASCFATGAAAAGAGESDVQKMHKIGEYAGMAFQIKDDLFDFRKSSVIGKPTGIDIKEKKMTLPLIYLLNNSPSAEKRKMINVVKRHNKNRKKVEWLMDKVNNSGGMKYAEDKMNEYRQKSLDLLMEFPDNQARAALAQLIDYSISRSK